MDCRFNFPARRKRLVNELKLKLCPGRRNSIGQLAIGPLFQREELALSPIKHVAFI